MSLPAFSVKPELCSSIAQLVEHAAVNRRVVGSSPTWGARTKPVERRFYGLFVFLKCSLFMRI